MCAWHDPQLATEREAWRRKGGQSRSNKARARKQIPDGTMTPAEIQGLLGLVLKGVIGNRIEARVGNAVANIARSMIAVREATETEARLTQLEEAAGLTARRGA